MSSQLVEAPTHPVAAFADRLNSRLDDLAEAPLLAMTPHDKRRGLVAFARAEAKLAALRFRLLADADTTGACLEAGAANAAGWMKVETQQSRRDARGDLELAHRLDSLPLLLAAMTTGAVNVAQARAVVKSLDRLPSSGEFAVSLDQRARAEAHLVGLCSTYDAAEIAVLGRRIFEVVAPEAAEAYDGTMLAAEEAKAARKTSFEMWTDDQGVAHGRFRIPRRHGEMLRKAIWALTNPVRRENTKASPIDPDLPTSVRQGVAFTQILEAIAAHWLPTAGGVGATVVVTMTLEQLVADLDAAGVCTTDTGGRISAAEARRLACQAGIIPVVLGRKSVVLDAGTKVRFHTEPMRIAMGLRDGGCTAEGCDVPASMCHAHHDIPFSEAGSTSVANGRLVCGHHHRRIHDPDYRHEKLPSGKVRFHRRT